MAEIVLIDGGRANCRIVVGRNASEPEEHAAAELQSHLEQISGARVPTAETAAADQPRILIGRGPETEKLVGRFDWTSLKEDGCIVRTAGRALILAGATPRGTLYATYEFLERSLGCRWLTARCSVIPKQQTISVGDLDVTWVPVFRYREPYYAIGYDADWAARNRVNGAFYPLDARRGGKWGYAGFVHTFYALVPPEEHFASHPEWFSEINGERVHAGGQLCLTNASLVDVVTARCRQWLKDQPEARVLSISQNDWEGNCRCRECRRVDEAEGSPAGSLVRFVNAVAERLEGDFPQVYFDTLAYVYTQTPPRTVRPRRNVIIRLCHMMPSCDGHPLDKCERNRSYLDVLRRWGEISPEVFVWDYFNNFHYYFMPFPNLDSICEDLPLYARSGVTGMFCQGDGAPSKGCGDMAELRTYLTAKLLWRPEADGRAIIQEFLDLYYGPAAEPVRDYLELLHRQVRGRDVHFHLYSTLDQPFLSGEVMAQANRLFDEAERRVKGDEELASRVAGARLPVEYMAWRRDLRFAVAGDRYRPSDEGLARRAERFFALASEHEAKALREGGSPMEKEEAHLRGYALARLEKGGLQLVVAPALGGRLLSLVDAGGIDWMHRARPLEPDYPAAGGYEEYSERQWRRPGWSENYECSADADSVRLRAALANGFVLSRTYRLEIGPDGPALAIESTLRNSGKERREATLRLHPELEADDWDGMSVYARRPNGEWQEVSPWRTSVEKQGDLWLREGDLPAGAWALRRGDRRLTMEYAAGDVATFLLGWDKASNLVRMEVFGRTVHLSPDEEVCLRQKWSVNRGGR